MFILTSHTTPCCIPSLGLEKENIKYILYVPMYTPTSLKSIFNILKLI